MLPSKSLLALFLIGIGIIMENNAFVCINYGTL